MAQRQFKKDVKTVRTDNGTEFTSLKSYFENQGILFQTSCVGTPQQNGVLKGNIVIFLMWQEFYGFKHTCRLSFGVSVF